MEPIINITDETLEIVDIYLKKLHERKLKRLANKTGVKNDDDQANDNKPKVWEQRDLLHNPGVYSNHFAKHITKLRKLKVQLEERTTSGDIPMKVEDNEVIGIDNAVKYIKLAINELEALKKLRDVKTWQ